MQVFQKSKIKYFDIPSNRPLIVLGCWSKRIEEYFHIRNPNNINLSEKSTTQYVNILINSMVKHVKYVVKIMIGIQENFIESDNYRLKQSIRIYQLIQENISTQKSLYQLLYVINNLHERVIRNYYNFSECFLQWLTIYWKIYIFLELLVTPHSPIKKLYQMLCVNLLPRKADLSLQP